MPGWVALDDDDAVDAMNPVEGATPELSTVKKQAEKATGKRAADEGPGTTDQPDIIKMVPSERTAKHGPGAKSLFVSDDGIVGAQG